jgi:hypothetical protein
MSDYQFADHIRLDQLLKIRMRDFVTFRNLNFELGLTET